MHSRVEKKEDKGRTEKLMKMGLHFCRHYKNLVQFHPEFCGKCPHNGLRRSPTGTPRSETCF